MKAIQLLEPSGTDALLYEDVARPEPDDDELLVRVHAAGVNPLDWLICSGVITELRDKPCPWIPGWDVSGIVESVGTGVTEFGPGDVVYGMGRRPGSDGTFTEYTTMTVDEITPKPKALSHIEAAGVPMAAQTAFHALYQEARLDSGQRILIHAAAGGIGHIAVQLAANTGAHVIGTASARNKEYLHELGVDEFVNYREQQFEDELDSVDIVLDAIGGAVLERSIEVAQPGGTVVTLPDQPSEEVIEQSRNEHDVDIRFFDVVLDSDPSILQDISAQINDGVVHPTVSTTYPLSKAQKALDRSADGHVRGKLVLDAVEKVDD